MTPPVDYSPLIFPIPPASIRAFLGDSGVSLERWGDTPEIGEATLRYLNFARANGLTFTTRKDRPDYPGMFFKVGRSVFAFNILRSTSDPFLEIGNLDVRDVSGEPEGVGYLALRLDRKLPHIVLDSRQNNGVFGTPIAAATNLPEFLDRSQVLSLEGDFDKYFTLYCPKAYERDALYLFTPDLMALLIDNAAPFDVEIVDDWMFVYSTQHFDSLRPQAFLRLFTIRDTVHRKALKQSALYSDERVGSFAANVIASPGKRLKPGILASVIVVLVIVLTIPVMAIVTFWIADR